MMVVASEEMPSIPANAGAADALLLREWSDPATQSPGTPVAIAVGVSNECECEGECNEPPVLSGSPLLALSNACWPAARARALEPAGRAVQARLDQALDHHGPAVAKLVTNVACHLKVSIDQIIYAGTASPIGPDADSVEGGKHGDVVEAAEKLAFGGEHVKAICPADDFKCDEEEWVVGGYNEARYRVFNDHLVEAVPDEAGLDKDELYYYDDQEEAFEEELMRRYGRGCMRRDDPCRYRVKDGSGQGAGPIRWVRKWIRRRREGIGEGRIEGKVTTEQSKEGPELVALQNDGDGDMSNLALEDSFDSIVLEPSQCRKKHRKKSKKRKKRKKRGWGRRRCGTDESSASDPGCRMVDFHSKGIKDSDPQKHASAPVAQCIFRGAPIGETPVAHFVGQYYDNRGDNYIQDADMSRRGITFARGRINSSPAAFSNAIADKIALGCIVNEEQNEKDGANEDSQSDPTTIDEEGRPILGLQIKYPHRAVDELIRDITTALEEEDEEEDDFSGVYEPFGTTVTKSIAEKIRRYHDSCNLKALDAKPVGGASSAAPSMEQIEHEHLEHDKSGGHDIVKVVFLASPGIDKSSIVDKLTDDSSARSSSSLVIRDWESPRPFHGLSSSSHAKFSIWDVPIGSNRSGHHVAVPSLTFSSDTLYVVLWDMAIGNTKTWARSHSDEFIAEKEVKKADRAIERDVDDNVLLWIDSIRESNVERSLVLPVAMSTGLDAKEERRRVQIMKHRLIYQNFSFENAPPHLIVDTECSSFIRTDSLEDGVKELGKKLVHIASQTQLAGESPSRCCPSLHDIDMLAIEDITRRAITEAKIAKSVKILEVASIVASITNVGVIRGTPPSIIGDAVRCSLNRLASSGFVLYFDNSNSSFANDEVYSSDLLVDFVIIDPKWFVSVVSCVQREDLKHELADVRSTTRPEAPAISDYEKADGLFCSILNERSNTPVITSNDASIIWESMSFVREAVTCPTSNVSAGVVYEYMKQVLVTHGVFVPIQISKYASELTLFLIPGLISDLPQDTWSYKQVESWRAVVCHSWLLGSRIQPGIMASIKARLLQDIFTSSNLVAPFRVEQVRIWKSAFMLRLAPDVDGASNLDGAFGGSIDVFGHLVGDDSHLAMASASTRKDSKKLVLSAKGQIGGGGRNIWKGGFDFIVQSIENSIQLYSTGLLEGGAQREVICPDCLSSCSTSVASWKLNLVTRHAKEGQNYIQCIHGHRVETTLLCGHSVQNLKRQESIQDGSVSSSSVPVASLLEGVVIVGLWDGRESRIKSIGSGFIADREKGLIITASHILFDMSSAAGVDFGKEYFGLRHGKAIIGVIPTDGKKCLDGSAAIFRYFADIIAHDVSNVDACVLRITSRIDQDIGDQIERCGNQVEIPFNSNAGAFKNENLHRLKLTKECELEESVRIVGFNQGGEGTLLPGQHINRYLDVARGYVAKKFKIHQDRRQCDNARFAPREEIVVMCPTIDGHSGGPVVNNRGRVIGILSRADAADKQRCYLVPATELKRLLRKARTVSGLTPLQIYQQCSGKRE